MTEERILILVIGVAGSGKTTLSKMILKEFRATYLDNNFIVDIFHPHTRTGSEYSALRPRAYAVLYRIAEENLLVGNSVLLDVPHIKEVRDGTWRLFIQDMAARTGARLVVIRCRCSEETLRRRIIARGEERDRWKLDHWDEFLKEQPVAAPIPLDHLDVNTEDDLAENVRRAVRHITAA